MRYPSRLRLFATAVMLEMGVLFAIGVVKSPAQSVMQFEVASIKLNTSGTTSMKFPVPAGGRLTATNIPLKALISFAAYGGQNSQLTAPDWTSSQRFDVDARAVGPNITREEYQRMLRALLEDRFKLELHHETRDLPAYELFLAKGGSLLKPADPKACDPVGATNDQGTNRVGVTCGTFFTGQTSIDARSMTMTQFANVLAIVLGRPVVDRSGIDGRFDIHLNLDPQGVNLGNGFTGLTSDADQRDGAQPSIFSALQQQLGLRLQSHKEPTDVIVIDRLNRLPTDN